MAQRSARKLALTALAEWRSGQRFADAIIQERLSQSQLEGSDRAFAVELFYGVLRNLTLLDFWIARLRSAALDPATRDLLRLGLYQLQLLRTPSHAAVFETVALATPRQRGLINGVLRNAIRTDAELEAAASAASLPIRTSHPAFLVERWKQTFGESTTESLCLWNNQPAPLYARINELRVPRAQFVAAHPESEFLPDISGFVRLPRLPIDALARGECYIQDPSTRVACELLDPQPGETVLDACAAPGGKSALLAAQMENRGQLLACDRDAARVGMLRENLLRLGVSIGRPLQHDWRDGSPPGMAGSNVLLFDRILVDAPCTNTGVIRRRIDVRWRLAPEDFPRMQRKQLQILQAVIPSLKPGGTLVYSTCSVEPEENEDVAGRLADTFRDLESVEQRSVLPFRDGFDGAFAAKFIGAR